MASVKDVNKELEKPRMSALQLADAGKKVEESLKGANTKLQEVFQSLAVTDPLALFGQSLVVLGSDLLSAQKNADSTTAAIKKLLDNTENARLINPQNFAQLLSLSDEFYKATTAVKDYQNEIDDTKGIIDQLEKSISRGGAGVQELVQEKLKQQAKLGELEISLSVNQSSVNVIQTEINKIAKETIRTGYDAIFKMANLALQKHKYKHRKVY